MESIRAMTVNCGLKVRFVMVSVAKVLQRRSYTAIEFTEGTADSTGIPLTQEDCEYYRDQLELLTPSRSFNSDHYVRVCNMIGIHIR